MMSPPPQRIVISVMAFLLTALFLHFLVSSGQWRLLKSWVPGCDIAFFIMLVVTQAVYIKRWGRTG